MRDDDFVPPHLPDDVVPEDLDIGARAQLKTLTKENAELVAKHMAMASRLIDEDPELAHQHALAASRRAGRIGVVRETLAITAYQLGDFALALRELRTYRRITGRDDQLPLMADCERGLGRPEKALELARSVDASTLETPVRVELAIVKSGARLDLGQKEAALEELRIPELRKDKAFDYSPALFASFGGVLEELGRDEEAAEWFELADRAIDALEDALRPGELEEIVITTERLESPVDEDGDDDVPLDEESDEESDQAPLDGELEEPAGDEIAVEETRIEADEPVAEDSVDEEPVVEESVSEESGSEKAVVDEEPQGDAVSAVESEAGMSVAGDDALFGDALFGDDLIEGEERPEGTR